MLAYFKFAAIAIVALTLSGCATASSLMQLGLSAAASSGSHEQRHPGMHRGYGHHHPYYGNHPYYGYDYYRY